jgi:hypothetical protein
VRYHKIGIVFSVCCEAPLTVESVDSRKAAETFLKCCKQAIALIDPSMSVMGIFRQLGSGVPVDPLAKSELLY